MKKSSCILSLYSCCSNNACLNTKLMYTKKLFQAIILSMVALCLGCSKSNIKTTLEYSYSNGVMERNNNTCKLIKRISFGFRNFRNMKSRIMIITNIFRKEKRFIN